MKYRLLRLSLLSMLVMLFGGGIYATFRAAGDEHTAVVDLANFNNEDKGYEVVKAGTSSTGGDLEISLTDISLTSSLGYAKKDEMSIYKTGSLTISLKDGVSAHITKIVVTLSNSYPFVEPEGWTTTYMDANGEAIEASTAAKVANKSVQTFTTDATDIKSLTLSNASNGKTGIRKIAITYVEDEKPNTPAAFQDFEITNEQLSGEFDASTLPACATFSGTQRNDNHGYGNVTITVAVDGPTKFTIGGCQYANPANCKVTNAAGEVLATPNLKTATCYHQDGATATYIYDGEPTTLTFSDIAYLPYFKAEATEIEPEPVAFQDFEITNEQLSGAFDASTLPACATFSGTQRNDSHGYGNVTITVVVDKPVKFTIGGCQYANPANCKVTNAAGEVLATPNLKTATCYHQDGAAATYTYDGEPTTLTFSDIAYLPYFKAEAIEDTPEPHDPVLLVWDYTNKDIPTTGPDNGLYYGAYVNDPAGTNNGMHGVKLNSSGWAYFEKPAVAGKLTLTFGNRKTADAYAVNVSTGTLGADNVGVKGDLIGEVAVAESPGTGSIDIPAEVTGIYINRKTGSEGVLSKIVFKEDVPRQFVDFEITNEQLSGAFDASTLPAGVTFNGTQRNDSHGYGNVTITVPVDGTVKFTIGGCQYANPANCKVTNAAGEVLATPNLRTATCYHQDGAAATYIYVGEPTTLTFSEIAYLPYFKAEATDVHEVTVTYKDQNGGVLGKKTVYEGDPIGEIPYTEADLTIPAGEKFRGWVYNSKIKVKATDIVNADVTVNASVTPIEEAPTVGSIQTYDLTQATFYPEDHENFSVEGGTYYNNHGFTFADGGSFTVAVTSKAQIVLNLCQMVQLSQSSIHKEEWLPTIFPLRQKQTVVRLSSTTRVLPVNCSLPSLLRLTCTK